MKLPVSAGTKGCRCWRAAAAAHLAVCLRALPCRQRLLCGPQLLLQLSHTGLQRLHPGLQGRSAGDVGVGRHQYLG